MSYRFITADWIYPVSSPRIREGVVVMDEQQVVEVITRDKISPAQMEYHPGIIVPGMINTHCHLELSHLKGRVNTGTGLLSFLYHVVNLRDIHQDDIDKAIAEWDDIMWKEGIQAVGDICNKTDTFATKEKSKIHYYSFVEVFDFLRPEMNSEFLKDYKTVFYKAPGLKSSVPHAPYSVSPGLFREINALNEEKATVSIHNQETQAEEDLFRTGRSGFTDFYKRFGFDLDHFIPTGKSSIEYAIAHMDPMHRTIFVHNTLTKKEDVESAHAWNEKVYWATCPNANLYIENQLPNYKLFIDTDARMTIGTDSLTSNWHLSILEEMKTITKYQSYIPFDTLLQWATINGAQALGMDDKLGSLDAGKEPGLILINLDPDAGQLNDPEVVVKRLV